MTITHLLQAQPPCIVSATFKTKPEDFCVTEHLGFDLSGEGEHLCLYVEKNGANTTYIAKQLAQWAGIPIRDVSFCGLKDRFAVTRQWFSLRIPKKKMPETPFDHPEATILKHLWHSKKLTRGSHKLNAFDITLRNVDGNHADIEKQLAYIKESGIPNYFGAQRFGHKGQNIEKITAIFSGELSKKKVKRNEYSILLSSARAYLFNKILSQRVKDGTWNQAVTGDVFNLNGTGSIFTTDSVDAEIKARIKQMDIHPTASLWGKGELKSSENIALLETSTAKEHDILSTGLEDAGLKQERRATRLRVDKLSWHWIDQRTLTLHFELIKGSYATSVLSALVHNLESKN